MKVLYINSLPYGSTGNIMLGLYEVARDEGIESFMVAGYTNHPMPAIKGKYTQVGGFYSKAIHKSLAYFTGLNGCFSVFATQKLLKKIDEIKPDIIHLHNLHCWYINIPMLFKYIKKKNIKTIWTLHDCWAFTGQCPHFQIAACNKWKRGCYKCSQYKKYPQSIIDLTKTMYRLKKKWFIGVADMTIVTPSEWLAGLVKESFLKDYPVKVINNGIDLSIFRPIDSNLRKELSLEDKSVLMGCAHPWNERKGLDVFISLADMLDDSYRIVLVGVSKEQKKNLPYNIIGIERTSSQLELAKLYSMADIFINPTREDNFPTVNIEALACGTPVITFNAGGSAECIDKTCGSVVEVGKIDEMEREIRYVIKEKPYKSTSCIKCACNYEMKDKFREYIKIYNGESNEIKGFKQY